MLFYFVVNSRGVYWAGILLLSASQQQHEVSDKMKILPRRPLGDVVLSEEVETCLARIRIRTPAKLPILARNVPRSTPIVKDIHSKNSL